MNAVSITMTMLAQRMRTNPKWSIIISIITYREQYNAPYLAKLTIIICSIIPRRRWTEMFEFKIGKKEGWAQIAWDSWGVFDYDMKIRIINIFFQLFIPRTQYGNAEFSNLLKTLKLNTNMSYSSGCMIIFFQFLPTKKCSSLSAGIWRLLCPGWPHDRIRWW